MKEKINKVIDIIGLIFLCTIIVLLNIYIGSSIKEPILIVQVISLIFGAIYAITKKFVSKENVFIKGKIDICVLLLVISTMLPLLFRTFVSYSGTYEFIMKYLSMYCVYIVTRNVVNNKKKIKIIANTYIISSIIVIAFAIDYAYFKNWMSLYEFLDTVMVNVEERMVGPFGYQNTMALYMSLNLLMAFACCLDSNKKIIQALYIVYIVPNVICLFLTVSRSVISLLIIIIAGIILMKYKNKINKKFLYIIGTTSVIGIVVILFLMQFSKPLDVTEKLETLYVFNLEPNTKYTFEFDIVAEGKTKNDLFSISLIEENRYLYDEIIETQKFSSFSGRKTIEFTTSEEFYQVKVEFRNANLRKYTVTNLYINGKEYVMKYKYLPQQMGWFLRTLNGKTESVWQRIDFYEDSMKIIQKHWLLGGGGNTWRESYQAFQQYNYAAKECHSYLLEVWMSFGLLGIISYIMIIVMTAKNVYKMVKQKSEKKDRLLINMIIGMSLIMVQSFVDFGMSFLLILVTIFVLLAIVNGEDKDIKYKFKLLDYICILIIAIAGICNGRDLYIKNSELTYEEILKIKPLDVQAQCTNINYKLRSEKNVENQKEILALVEQYANLENMQDQIYIDSICNKIVIELIEQEKVETNQIKTLIERWKKENNKKFNNNIIMARLGEMGDLANAIENLSNRNEEMKKYADLMYSILEKEYENNCSILADYKKIGISKSRAENNLKQYKEKYNDILSRRNIDE